MFFVSFSLFACLCSYGLSFVFLSLAFLPSCLPSTSLPMQLVFLCRLYSSAVRLSSAGDSLSLSTCSPTPTPSSAGCLASFFLLLRSLSASFLRFLSDSSPLVAVLVLSLSLVFSFSCLFSVISNTVQGCLSVRFDLVCRLLFLSSGFVFYVTERGGVGGPVLFVFCESEWVTHMFVSFTLRGVLLSLFALFSPFGLRLALFIAPVSGACFPAQGFLFLVVRGLSDCWLPLLFFSGCCPVLLCLFPFPWSCLFLWWPALPPPYVSPLGSPYFLSPAVGYFFFRCRLLRYVVFSTLLPFLCYDGSALR